VDNTKTLLVDLRVSRNPERFTYDKTITSIEVKITTGTVYLSFSKNDYKFNLKCYEKISCPSKEFFIYNKKQKGFLILELTFAEQVDSLLNILMRKVSRCIKKKLNNNARQAKSTKNI